MLYHLLDWLERTYEIPGFGVFQFITFRAVLAAVFSLIISLWFGKRLIGFLRLKLIGETIRKAGPESHKLKAGTPTMGGVIILAAIIFPVLLWSDLSNAYVLLLALATLWMGLIGFLDDYIKVFKKNKSGLKGKFKIFGQVGLGLIVGVTMVTHPDFRGHKPRVSEEGLIKSNEFLRQTGFQNKDRLLKVDGAAYEGGYEGRDISDISSYTVVRGEPGGPIEQQLVQIPADKRAIVANELFGFEDPTLVTRTNVPFFKNFEFDYGSLVFWSDAPIWSYLIYILVAIFIVTAVSNGVNITDGLDGLAAGTTAIVGSSLGVFAYLSGNIIFADYLNITFIPLSGELLVFSAALIGACIGFLWFNAHPAQVFMGDTGSLALGGAVGVIALMIKKELLLPIICGVFFAESLSVIAQVAYFKYTKKKTGEGRRIFRMSPLHHHYELGGWHESKIVTRFWIVTILLEILAFATLKLR